MATRDGRARAGAREAVAEVTWGRRRRPAVRKGAWPTIGPSERSGNEQATQKPVQGSPGRRARKRAGAAAHSHRSRAIGGVLMPHLYKRSGNHWKTPTRFERRETAQGEESQPLRRKSGRPRSLKDIVKAKSRR